MVVGEKTKVGLAVRMFTVSFVTTEHIFCHVLFSVLAVRSRQRTIIFSTLFTATCEKKEKSQVSCCIYRLVSGRSHKVSGRLERAEPTPGLGTSQRAALQNFLLHKERRRPGKFAEGGKSSAQCKTFPYSHEDSKTQQLKASRL